MCTQIIGSFEVAIDMTSTPAAKVEGYTTPIR